MFIFIICRFFYVFIIIFVFWDVVVVLDIFNMMRGNKLNEVRRVVLIVLEILSVKDNVSLYIWEVVCFLLN